MEKLNAFIEIERVAELKLRKEAERAEILKVS